MSPSLLPLGVLAGALLLLVVQSAGAADCTYRKDSLGNTRYQCDDGNGLQPRQSRRLCSALIVLRDLHR